MLFDIARFGENLFLETLSKQKLEQNFTLEITADDNFFALSRIINILTRRRVHIRKLMAHENKHDFSKGVVIILLFITPDMIEKISLQLDKLIEVENVRIHEGSHLYFNLRERVIDVD